MDEESKYGITLEKYIELIVKTINTGENEIAYKIIIESEGIDMQDWKKAKKEWDEEINDPNDKSKTYTKFIPLYQAALERQYFGRVPCSLEEFTKIHCELSFRKDIDDPLKPIQYEKVLKENRITANKWDICNSFWTVRVGMPNYRKKFSELVRKYSQDNSNSKFGKVS
jgi:hypothetical protein